MKLSVVIPVYNEENHIRDFVSYLVGVPCIVEREFIFVDDGSRDKTAHILRELSLRHGFTLIVQPTNKGKGAATKAGIAIASGDFIVVQDADFEYDHNDVSKLVAPLLDGHADVVYGSRFKKNSPQVHRTYHYFINRSLTIMSNLLSNIYLTDMETCYKLFRSDLLKSMNLRSNRFGIEVELTAYIAKTSARILEFPISYYPRTRLQGKKINWKDGVAALFQLVDFNLLTSRERAFSNLPQQYVREHGTMADTKYAPSFPNLRTLESTAELELKI